MRNLLLLTVCTLLFHCPCVRAQTTTGEDLKVGLVLSGGGAKGYAHIGALQVLEEAGVRADFIGGTSMGSIIGGLYAAGYSAHQLEEMLRATDIMSELVDQLPRSNTAIYERLNNEKYIVDLSMKDFSIQLPAGYSDGQRVHDLFTHWTAAVGHIRDFSKLPTPFLAVATDLQTGADVVLREGSLAEAMRASAALPGVLTPFKIGDRFLTDGGVSNNYPAEEVRAMGADYILGISVESDPLKGNEITSLDQLLMQIAFFQANRRNVEQYEITDLDIKPDLSEFSVLSFDAIDSLIARGRRAALTQIDELRTLAARQSGSVQPDTTAAPIPEELWVSEIEVVGNTRLSDRQVLAFFNGQLPGRMDWMAFRRNLIDLYATKRYFNINYSWEKNDNGSLKMKLELLPYEDPGQRLRLGIHYDHNYQTSLLFGLKLSDLIVDNTELNVNFIVSKWLRYNLDYRVDRINGTAFGIRSGLQFVESDFRLPRSVNSGGIQLENIEFTFEDLMAEAYWDLRQTDNSLTGVALEVKRYEFDSDQLGDETSMMDEGFRPGYDAFLVPKAYLLYDKLDKLTFPLRGFSISAELRGIRNMTQRLNNENGDWHVNLDVAFSGMLPLGSKTAVGGEASFGLFLNNESALPYRYYLGGNNRNFMNNFHRFESLDIGEASGSRLLMGEVYLRQEVITNHYLHLGAQAAQLANPENLPGTVDEENFIAAKVMYGINSPLGPIQLTYAYGNGGSRAYFNFGYWF